MAKYTDTHKIYYNSKGEEIPSATTILKLISKPALVKWANYLGFRRINVDDELFKSSEYGTMIHEFANCILQNKIIIYIEDDYPRQKVLRSLSPLVHWITDNDIEPIHLEKEFISDEFNFGGTLDFYGKVNGKYEITDFKTSKQIRLSMFIQLALYIILLEEHGNKVDQCRIILLNDKNRDSKVLIRSDMEDYVIMAKNLITTYNIYYNLNEKYGWDEFIK